MYSTKEPSQQAPRESWVMKKEHTVGLRQTEWVGATITVLHGHPGECKLVLWEMYSGGVGSAGLSVSVQTVTQRTEENMRESRAEGGDNRVGY